QQHPIESKFASNLVDNLNAEIALGTVADIEEGISWLNYTYLFVRMRKNPLAYGISHSEIMQDPQLGQKRRELIIETAKILHRNQMIVFNEQTGTFSIKDLGRIASLFYIKAKSVE